MNRSTILALAIVLSSFMIVSGTDICNNAPCEPQINASLGKEFVITLESNPSTGFEWWTKFDPNYLSLLNMTFVRGNEMSEMVGVPGKEVFTFNAINTGDTDVIMLLLNPWENGTIVERKIFPINIISTTATPKQAIALGNGANPYQSLGGLASQTIRGTSAGYFKNESVMETPSQSIPQSSEPSRYASSSLNERSY